MNQKGILWRRCSTRGLQTMDHIYTRIHFHHRLLVPHQSLPLYGKFSYLAYWLGIRNILTHQCHWHREDQKQRYYQRLFMMSIPHMPTIVAHLPVVAVGWNLQIFYEKCSNFLAFYGKYITIKSISPCWGEFIYNSGTTRGEELQALWNINIAQAVQ